MLLLDTHIFLWLLEEAGKLRPESVSTIDRSARDGDLCVSASSFWELGLLDAAGRIRIEQPFADWLSQAKTRTGIAVAPLTEDMAFDSTRLPGEFHNDPADRFIVATARALDATLVTRDSRILRYGSQGHVSVMAA